MDSFTTPSETYPSVTSNHLSRGDLKIALQSAFAAGLCLGLPPGLYFWVLIVQRWLPTAEGNILLNFLQVHLVPPVTLEMLGAFAWGLCLGKISGYRLWWRLSAATMAGVWIGNFALYHGWLELNQVQDQALSALSLHTRFVIIVILNVLSVTLSTGLLLGLAIINWRAGLMMAGYTGIASVAAVILTLILLGGLGIRVGSGNLAMPKATAAATMVAALVGGATLGVVFTHFIRPGFSNLK